MNIKTYRNALQGNHQLLWYRIEKVIDQGSFGITYLATDTNLKRQVAIKEYLPVDLAMREIDSSVQPIAHDRQEMYCWGLERFIEEARALAKFKHPNVVRVHHVFEANNTAYMVMEYEQGESFSDLIYSGKIGDEKWLLNLLLALLDGLEHVHEAGFIHRDIKPANLQVRFDDSPVLLDFGSARMALGTQTRTLTTLVSPGYAPYEQYSTEWGRQGPWTDIYALGATTYTAIAGKGPVDAILRANAHIKGQRDPLVPAIELGRGRYAVRFLEAVDVALEFLPEDRPQNLAEWRQQLLRVVEDQVAASQVPQHLPPWDKRDRADIKHRARQREAVAEPPEAMRTPRSDRVSRQRMGFLRLIGGLILVVAGVGLWMGWHYGGRSDSAQNKASQNRVSQPSGQGAPTVQQGIAQLMEKAESAFQVLRLTLSPEEHAPEHYPAKQKLDTNNAQAKQGLERIVGRDVALANRAVNQGEFDRAERYVDRAQALRPSAEVIRLTQGREVTHQDSERERRRMEVERELKLKSSAAIKLSDVPTGTILRYALADAGLGEARAALQSAMAAHERGELVSAVSEFRALADRNIPQAQFALGLLYERGEGAPQDDGQALKWYRKAAEQGDSGAQNSLGLMHAEGRGVSKDDEDAVAWFRKAAEQGKSYAQNNLGVMYAGGRGVSKNDEKAVAWYRRAAEQGNSLAQNNLGWMYAEGRGVSKDDAKAVAWFRKAAEQGERGAQYNLGRMYDLGRGVPRNQSEALKWLRRAQKQGLDQAGAYIKGMCANPLTWFVCSQK